MDRPSDATPPSRPDAGAAFAVEVGGEERLVIVQEVERQARGQADEAIPAIRRAVAEGHELDVYAVCLLRPMSLPRTSSGKVQRHACREGFLAETLEVVAQSVVDFREQRPDEAAACGADANPTGRTAAEIRGWLAARIAAMVGVRPDEIDRAPGVRRLRPRLAPGGPPRRRAGGVARAVRSRPPSPMSIRRSRPWPATWRRPRFRRLGSRREGRSTETQDEPIAIIGIGCRFPGACGPEAFWRLLRDGVDAVGEVPADRWAPGDRHDSTAPTNGHHGIAGAASSRAWTGSTPTFFGISPREAARIDPQQRLLLEVAWEALEDAGQAPERLAGEPVGVFVGISTDDYSRLHRRRGRGGRRLRPDRQRGEHRGQPALVPVRLPGAEPGRRHGLLVVAGGRPPGLPGLHAGEASLALAGGVNLILSPEVTASFARAGFLAADGRCKTFDARADGYVRGEGAGLVVLKPLSAALADGDPIYAVIRGGAVNQDGRTNGLTAPSPQAQEAVLRDAYRRAGVAPGRVAVRRGPRHGDAPRRPDRGQGPGRRARRGPGRRSASRGRLGEDQHRPPGGGGRGRRPDQGGPRPEASGRPAEPALPRAQPAHPLRGPPAAGGARAGAVARDDGPALAGVSSFGFGGSNAHLVLEGVAPSPTEPASADETTGVAHLLPLSARSPGALDAWLAQSRSSSPAATWA